MLEWFHAVGVNLTEIYGMSESSGPQLTNTMEAQRVGSIGKSFLGFESVVRPAKDAAEVAKEQDGGGELCMKVNDGAAW